MVQIFKINSEDLPKGLEQLFTKRFIRPSMKEVKAFDVEKEMIIEGIANFAEVDRCYEIMDPGCWDLENFKKIPIILLEHDRHRPIGICIDVQVKDSGLYYRAQIGDPSKGPLTEDQIKARSLLAQGILRANSVGFLPKTIEWDEEKEIVRYTDVELLEISIVSIPMQQDSLVTSVKSFKGQTDMSGKKEDGQSTDEFKSMLQENTDCTKKIHDMVQKMYKAMDQQEPDADDDKKALKAENETLKAENATLKAEKEEIEVKANELLNTLEKQGLLQPEGSK